MLLAIVAMYKLTECIVGTAIVTASTGVHQGCLTSCLLFVIFVNDLITLIKQNCCADGFLAWLHVLVLMDDTVLLSTSRAAMLNKIRILKDFCTSHGMEINLKKTKFFVINGSEDDRHPMNIEGLVVEACQQYVYLGSPFTADGSATSAISAHAQSKMCHTLKFVSFVNKNNDIPFIVKCLRPP